MTKILHIEHPEDTILTGDTSFLQSIKSEFHLSVKVDGAPAIVWGTNPATGKFFVGTKSVFNKVKIMINESHADIDANHTGNVADILHKCFDFLPDPKGGIFQVILLVSVVTMSIPPTQLRICSMRSCVRKSSSPRIQFTPQILTCVML